ISRMLKMFRTVPALLILVFLMSAGFSYAVRTQQQQQIQPGPGKKIVQGLFGPIGVDVSDPRPGIAFGPPLQTPTPPAPNPPAPGPQPTAAAPSAPTQNDQVIPVQLHFNNAELHQVIDVIAGLLAINYVVDPTVRGTVNVNSSGEIRRSDLLPILE